MADTNSGIKEEYVNVMPDVWADLSHLTLDEKREYYRMVLERRARQRFYRFHNIGREYGG